METLIFENISKIVKNKKLLEEKLKVKITTNKKQITIDGDPLDEYEAEKVLEAIDFGFTTNQSLNLTDPDFEFRKLNIKDYTRRKNLREVKARIIGTKGKTKKTLEDISGCSLIIKDNAVGILGPIDAVESATIAIGNLIKGTKQGNIYRYLEKMNKMKKEERESLGLKINIKSKK